MNLEEKIEWLENELKELKEEVKKRNENNGVWKPKAHEMCHSIDDVGNICEWYWLNSEDDEASLSMGNVFQTWEEARFMLERLKVIHELKQFTTPFLFDEENWVIYYFYLDNKIHFECYENCQDGALYFESEEKAREAIEAVGEDRVKKYYLQVKED